MRVVVLQFTHSRAQLVHLSLEPVRPVLGPQRGRVTHGATLSAGLVPGPVVLVRVLLGAPLGRRLQS